MSKKKILLFAFFIVYINLDKTPRVLKEIKNGKYFLVNDAKIEKQLDRIFSSYSDYIIWTWRDINSDDILELILTEKEKVIGIFALCNNDVIVVLWDDVETTDYYELCETGLLYYSQYYGIYDKERYELYQFDKDWNEELVRGFEIYCITDVADIDKGKERMPFNIDRPGNYYLEFWKEDGIEKYKELTPELWLKGFEILFGKTYQGDI